jgi:hypothetical protein
VPRRRTERDHRGRAAQLLAFQEHADDRLNGAAALGQRCPERLVRDPWLYAPSLVAVEPAHRVAWLLLLPRHDGLEPPHVCLGEGQRQRGAHAEVHVDDGLLERLFDISRCNRIPSWAISA